MSVGTAPSRIAPPPPPAIGESRERERLIQRQLARTTLQVRLVDLASSIAVWLIGVAALFIVSAVVDHTLGLGLFGRCTALAVLVAVSLWYLATTVAPLLVRAINPQYAARTIEEATPTLKNSLINFLLLRHDRSNLKEIVYQAVEKQAAADIAAVPVEATVDRSRLIHAGYALCVVLAVLAGYKILSPKDPFQSVARVLAPWAEIARPSRVQVSQVEPGNAEVYYGQVVPISATVRNVRDGEKVLVRYSTADGQTIDAALEMKLSAGDHYECQLPPGDSNSPHTSGLLQNVTYRIIAGDAESLPYRLTVVSAPTIIVDRLDYQYPAYTGKRPESVTQQGDIKALEGTKVTIHALANQPIKSAWIEFDPTARDGAAEIVALAAEGERASGTLTLLLKPDRVTPWHGAYQVRFYNERTQRSQQPILHKIEVIRDLPPEVQILRPQRLRVEVPEDGEETIEVRAADPDFGLSALRIEGAAGGKPPLSINLLPDDAAQRPQITVPYAFRPSEHNLRAGDELRYAAVAEDNRTNPTTGQPEPNVARSPEYVLLVTAPRNRDDGKGQNQQPGGNKQNQQRETAQPGDKQQNQTPQNNQARNNQAPKTGDKNQQPAKTGEKGGEKGDKNDKSNQQKADQQKNGQQSGQQQQKSDKANEKGGQQQQGGKQQEGGQPNQKGQGQQGGSQQQQPGDQQGDQASGGGQSAGGQQNGTQKAGEQNGQSRGQSSGAGKEGSSTGAGESGSQPAGQAGNRDQSGNRSGDNQNTPDAKSSSGEPSGNRDAGGKASHDGQAIERIWEKLKDRWQKGSDKKGSDKKGSDKQSSPSGNDQNSNAGEKGEKSDKQPSDQSGKPQTGGASGAQNQNVPNAGRPEGDDQRLNQPPDAKQGPGKPGDSNQRLPDDKEGQNPSQQESAGNKGGAPRGGSKTDKADPSAASKAEDRDPGAGKNGDEGAGQASKDKSGSGVGLKKNQDRNKDMQHDSSKPQDGDPSPGSISDRQSNSKGGESGEQSGGGKQGHGQSTGQQGNDSAGTKAAGDQGAGKANESGGGETGNKASDQQKAASKTGKQGDDRGDGSGSRAGNDSPSGSEKGASKGDPSAAKSKESATDQRQGSSSGQQPAGGKDDGRERFLEKAEATADQEADAANLEYSRRATEMVLKHLKEEEHNPDPELLDKLGWSKDDLAEFLRRWEGLQKSAEQSPTGKRELDEALKSLGLRDPANLRRAGGKVSDDQRNIRDAGNRSAPPARYRDLFDAFRKGAARSTP